MSARLRPLFGLVVAVASVVAVVPVAEASFPGRNGMLAFSRADAQQTIWLANPRTGRVRQLTRLPRRCAGSDWDDVDPSFSPSGRLVVYAHHDECDPRRRDGLYVIRTDGRGRRFIPADTGSNGQWVPVFSPSGTSLAFADLAGSTFITSLEEPERQRELRLPRRDYRSGYAAWGATGRLGLVVGRDFLNGHIATVRPNGEDLRLVTRSVRDAMPDWSPTADRVVFVREKENSPAAEDPARGDILVASTRGRPHRHPRRLTHSRHAENPVWSPDGRYIAYVRDDGPLLGSLVIIRAQDGRHQRRVTSTVESFSRISWQPRPRR